MKRATFALAMGLVVVTGGAPGAGRWMETTSAAPAKASPANALIDITVNEGTRCRQVARESDAKAKAPFLNAPPDRFDPASPHAVRGGSGPQTSRRSGGAAAPPHPFTNDLRSTDVKERKGAWSGPALLEEPSAPATGAR